MSHINDEWAIDQQVDMGEDIVYRRVFSIDELFERESGVDRNVQPVVFESRYQFGNGFWLIEWFAPKNCYTVMFLALGYDFFDY